MGRYCEYDSVKRKGEDEPASVESNVGGCAVRVELDIQRGSVGREMQAACHAVGALAIGYLGHAVGLEQAADQQAVDADVLWVPGGHTRGVAVVETLVPIFCVVEHPVVTQPLSWVVIMDIAPVNVHLVHLVLDRPLLVSKLKGSVSVCFSFTLFQPRNKRSAQGTYDAAKDGILGYTDDVAEAPGEYLAIPSVIEGGLQALANAERLDYAACDSLVGGGRVNIAQRPPGNQYYIRVPFRSGDGPGWVTPRNGHACHDILALADLAGGSIVVVSLYGSKVGREKCFAVGAEYDPVVGLAKLVSGWGYAMRGVSRLTACSLMI